MERDISKEKIPNLDYIPDIVKYLVPRVNVNVRTDNGETPLFLACTYGALHNAALLVRLFFLTCTPVVSLWLVVFVPIIRALIIVVVIFFLPH